jgi:hypothetical protein
MAGHWSWRFGFPLGPPPMAILPEIVQSSRAVLTLTTQESENFSTRRITMRDRMAVCWGVAVLGVLLRAVTNIGCGGHETALRGSFTSPDRTMQADWYQLYWGAGAGWGENYVRLRSTGEPFREGPDYVFASNWANVIKIRSVSNELLEVSYPKVCIPFRERPRWRTVTISYSQSAER